MKREPYYINPDIDALRDCPDSERALHIRRIAACVGDEAALRSIFGMDPEEFARFYPDMLPPDLTTEAAIDSFITLFSKEKKPAESAAAAENEGVIPTAPAMDYLQLLAHEEGAAPADEGGSPADATADAISNFLQAVPPKVPAPRVAEPRRRPAAAPQTTPPEAKQASPELSEELFKLMVRNGNYTKALEIIDELSLNNPKKNAYFAVQIRFLKKLIKNQENQARQRPVAD